jgi:hypothetical protein
MRQLMKVETVTEHMLFSTVRLEAEKSTGTASGTGFIFSYRMVSARWNHTPRAGALAGSPRGLPRAG